MVYKSIRGKKKQIVSGLYSFYDRMEKHQIQPALVGITGTIDGPSQNMQWNCLLLDVVDAKMFMRQQEKLTERI